MLARLLRAACALLVLTSAAAGAGSEAGAPAAKRPPAALAALGDKPLLVNFWATWCTPCRAEIPALVAANERGDTRGITFVGVAVEDDEKTVREFAARHEMGYAILTGREQALELMRELGNDRQAVPYTVAIDRNGRIVARKIGFLRQSDLDRMLLALLER